MLAFFLLIYYVGITACGIQGTDKGTRIIQRRILGPFFTSFGGGIMRDLLLLHVWPVAFTYECAPDIAASLLGANLYASMDPDSTTQRFAKRISSIADAFGLGTFIVIGADKAIQHGLNPLLVILSGILTSLGGGITASIMCGAPIDKVLLASSYYRLIACLGSVLYTTLIKLGIAKPLLQYAVVLYTATALLVSQPEVQTALRHYFKRASRRYVALYSYTNYWYAIVYILIEEYAKYPIRLSQKLYSMKFNLNPHRSRRTCLSFC